MFTTISKRFWHSESPPSPAVDRLGLNLGVRSVQKAVRRTICCLPSGPHGPPLRAPAAISEMTRKFVRAASVSELASREGDGETAVCVTGLPTRLIRTSF